MAEQYARAQARGLAAPELAGAAAGLASLGAPGAATAGLTAGHKDEAPRLAGAEGFREQSREDGADCPDVPPTQQGDAKRFATLRARLALAGWTLSRCESEGLPAFVALRWNMPRELADLAAVEQFADLVGAPA